MNPLALPGPQFLVFYVLFAVIVLGLLYLGRRAYETGAIPTIELKDPYLFACLNGGPTEVIRVATVGLVDRGLLQLTGGTAHPAPNMTAQFGQPQIEREVLQYFRGGASVSSAWQNSKLRDVVATNYEDRLRSLDLLPNAATLSRRRVALALAVAALLGLGVIKIWIALSAGRRNVEILIVLMIVATVLATHGWNNYRTRLGDDYLASVRTLFAGLRDRAGSLRPGGATREVLWLTALFGAALLPSAVFPVAAYAWPKPVSSSSGSSCGGGSSGGGGGGCGGGGGGCGGCGS
jgi:uncharacterized protein (TIGR04222 family)